MEVPGANRGVARFVGAIVRTKRVNAFTEQLSTLVVETYVLNYQRFSLFVNTYCLSRSSAVD